MQRLMLRGSSTARLLWLATDASARGWPPEAYAAIAEEYQRHGRHTAAARWRWFAYLKGAR